MHRAMKLSNSSYAKILLILALIFNASACSVLPEIDDETSGWSARQLYDAGKNALNTADYETALRYLESLEARFPYGRYAQQAQMDIIFAYYKFDEPESAIAAADRFIKLYPRHPKVDYAYYMRGLASFYQSMGTLDYLFNLDPSKREARGSREAFQYFSTLIKQYPNSDYAADSAQRLIYLHNVLAKHEVNIANYYIERGAYVAAANRAKYVINNYERTPSAIEALIVMVKAYRYLGLTDLAHGTFRILQLNAPEHPDLTQLKKG